MTYAFFVFLGVVLGVVMARLSGPPVAQRPPAAVTYAGLAGAVAGAYLFQLPADLMGWAPEAEHAFRLGGRTVLGGLLGGWLSVEVAKWRVGHRAPTGDAFAVGLPLSLGMGRLGCVFAGCCPGVPLDPASPWAQITLRLHGDARFPATLFESYFHIGAAVVIFALTRRGIGSGLRLLGYFIAYGAFRFAIEFGRDVPRPLLGLSYYQVLAAILGLCAAVVFALRYARGRAAGHDPANAPA